MKFQKEICNYSKRHTCMSYLLCFIVIEYCNLLVVVDSKLRGRGLGRRIMEACESHVINLGMNSLHLSTHDKQHFYTHLGYTDGPIVSGVRHSAKAIQESLVS